MIGSKLIIITPDWYFRNWQKVLAWLVWWMQLSYIRTYSYLKRMLQVLRDKHHGYEPSQWVSPRVANVRPYLEKGHLRTPVSINALRRNTRFQPTTIWWYVNNCIHITYKRAYKIKQAPWCFERQQYSRAVEHDWTDIRSVKLQLAIGDAEPQSWHITGWQGHVGVARWPKVTSTSCLDPLCVGQI